MGPISLVVRVKLCSATAVMEETIRK